MPDPVRNAVFLSYAREDAAAARRIFDALGSQGIEVWFDQSELRGGDSWDQKIRRQIRECTLFVPVISANTHERSEGYFRLEWKLAAERTHLMRDGVPFLVPVVIDHAPEDATAVPEAFMRVQWSRLPGGLPTPDLIAQLKRLLASPRKPEVVPAMRAPFMAVPPGAEEDPSVAVLAFANMSRDPENEFFSDGISEELLNVLAKMPGLRVAARTSSFFFKGKNVPVPEIARTLDVSYVVEGSVRQAGQRVRITAQLINARSGFHLWSDTYDRELKDIFALQDEIAHDIAQKLELKLGQRTRVTRTVNPEAHRLVLEGRHFWHLRTSEGFTRSDAAFTRALALDPNFAEAHCGLAEACVAQATYEQWDGATDTTQTVERARTAALRAIQLDPRLPDSYATLGMVFMYDHELTKGELQFQTAFGLNPNSPLAHTWHGILLSVEGRLDDALGAYDKAAQLNPLWFTNLALYASRLFHARRYEKALEINQRAVMLRADIYMINHGIQPQLLLAAGRTAEAVDAARFVRQRPELGPRWLADSIAIAVLRQVGLEQEASDYMAELFARWPADSFHRGFVLGAFGRFDDALPFLERTPYMPAWWLFWDPMWDQWRDDPRFLQMITKLGRAAEYQVARTTLARMLAEQAAPA